MINIKKGYVGIGLDNPKTPLNVGSAMRACGFYGTAQLVYSGSRYKKASKFVTDPQKNYKHIPMLHANNLYDLVPYDCVPVAIELIEGAKSLPDYKHPERAFYIFGPEDSTLDKKIIDWCRDIVYVSGNGCMNLAATVNVVLYDRMAKGL